MQQQVTNNNDKLARQINDIAHSNGANLQHNAQLELGRGAKSVKRQVFHSKRFFVTNTHSTWKKDTNKQTNNICTEIFAIPQLDMKANQRSQFK